MKRLAATANPQSGLTIIELLVAMSLSSIIIGAGLSVGYTLLNGAKEQKRVLAAERAGRATLRILADAIRNASPAVPNGNVTDLVGCSTFKGISVVNNDASNDYTDSLSVIYGSGAVLTSLSTDLDATSTSFQLVSTDGLQAGDYILISNLTEGILVKIEAPLNTATGTGSFLVPGGCVRPAVAFPAGSLVIRAKIATFAIDRHYGYASPTQGTGTPILTVDSDGSGPLAPEPIAEGVEDIQIAVAADQDLNGVMEWYSNDPFVAAAPPVDAFNKPLLWRALRVTVVTRTFQESSTQTRSRLEQVEDREADAADDVYRRRYLSTTVELRNFTGSP